MSDTFWQRLVRGVRRVWERPDWAEFVGADWPARILQQEATDDFHAKQGRSTGRWQIMHEGRTLSVYLKRHYRLPWWQRVLAVLWPWKSWSPALQELHHLQWAQAHGLPVPQPVAAVEFIGPWGRLQSMLAIEELIGMLPLHKAIPLAAIRLPEAAFRRWKRSLVAEVARLSQELHRRGYFHQDLYLCHFYLPQADIDAWQGGAGPDGRGRLHLIDLHRLGHRPWAQLWWQIKDLAQLYYSSAVAGVTDRDRVLFWRLYRAGSRRRRSVRWLETFVRLKWRRYRDHNRKRARRQGRTETTTIRNAA
jgi:heptose I phosphotransferase